jgi:hypothetical protein
MWRPNINFFSSGTFKNTLTPLYCSLWWAFSGEASREREELWRAREQKTEQRDGYPTNRGVGSYALHYSNQLNSTLLYDILRLMDGT